MVQSQCNHCTGASPHCLLIIQRERGGRIGRPRCHTAPELEVPRLQRDAIEPSFNPGRGYAAGTQDRQRERRTRAGADLQTDSRRRRTVARGTGIETEDALGRIVCTQRRVDTHLQDVRLALVKVGDDTVSAPTGTAGFVEAMA